MVCGLWDKPLTAMPAFKRSVSDRSRLPGPEVNLIAPRLAAGSPTVPGWTYQLGGPIESRPYVTSRHTDQRMTHVVITNEPHLIEFEQVGLNAGLSELLSGSAVAVSAPHVAYHLSAARPGPSATSPWPARRPPVDFGAKNIQARDSRSQKV